MCRRASAISTHGVEVSLNVGLCSAFQHCGELGQQPGATRTSLRNNPEIREYCYRLTVVGDDDGSSRRACAADDFTGCAMEGFNGIGARQSVTVSPGITPSSVTV
jgi:hypothetical protein